MTDGIYRLLRQASAERFEGSFAWLAEHIGVTAASVSKYVHVDPAQQRGVIPASQIERED